MCRKFLRTLFAGLGLIILLLTAACQGQVDEAAVPPGLEPLFTDAEITTLDGLESGRGTILRENISTLRGPARRTIFPDGSLFWCECSEGPFSLTLTSSSGWEVTELASGDGRAPILAAGKGILLLLQPPLAREPGALDGTNYRAIDADNGTVSCSGTALNIQFDGACADWWLYAVSDAKASDWMTWLKTCAVEKFGADNRMTLDGYYYTTPDNYFPSGQDMFWRIPAAYIATRLARQTDDRHAHQLSVAMLNLHIVHMNENGFMPSPSKSSWLFEDYGIEAGFHDTRFNTDLAYAMLLLGKAEGISDYTDHAMRYAQFLSDHAKATTERTENGGIFSPDYSHPSGNPTTLTSLNHQLAEILFLYKTGKPEYIQLSGQMLCAIEDTVSCWILPNGNLNYARYPDGTFGGNDYPYLTYNDLHALNGALGGNPALQKLMDSKLLWMRTNGISGYVVD